MQDVQPRLPLDAILRFHAILQEKLVKHGFESDAETGIYSRSRVSELDDWIWLPVDFAHDSREGGGVRITANLAIFCEPLADWLRQEHPTNASHLATLTRNIGYLMPGRRWKEWTFSASDPVEEVAHDVAGEIERFGLPWFEECESLEDLRDEFEKSGGKDHRELSVPRLELHLADTHSRPSRRKRTRPAQSAGAGVGGGDRDLWLCDD